MKKIYVLTCVLLSVSLFGLSTQKISATTTTVAVSPTTTIANSGDTFNISITVSDITNFTAWELDLFYLKAVVSCSNATEGPFLRSGGFTYFYLNITNNYNSTYGRVEAASTITGLKGVNGGGTILIVTFKAMSGGTTNLTLSNTQLLDEELPIPGHIPHQDINGSVTVQGGAHDLAVKGLISLKTIIGQGYSGNITITVEDHGGFAETFNVTTYANTTAINITSVTMAPGDSTLMTIVWNATGFAYGNYTLTAAADIVPGEVNPGDNNYTSNIPVHVGVPGDVSSSTPGVYEGITNMKDIAYLVSLFNTKPSSPNWNPNADVNNDGVCNMKDIAISILNFNKKE